MRNILCGGTKAGSHLEEKRKRFPLNLPFRRKPKGQSGRDASAPASIDLKISSVFVAAAVAPLSVAALARQNAPPADPLPPLAQPEAEAAAPAQELGAAAVENPRPLDLDAAPPPAPAPHAVPPPSPAAAQDAADAAMDAAAFNEDVKTACTIAVLDLFPEICPTFLQETSENLAYDYETIVSYVLDQIEEGKSYPRRAPLKRKRNSGGNAAVAAGVGIAGPSSGKAPRLSLARGESVATSIDVDAVSGAAVEGGEDDDYDYDDYDDDNDDVDAEKEAEAIKTYSSDAREAVSSEYVQLARSLLQQAYVFVPHKFIVTHLSAHGDCLLPALLALETHITTTNPTQLGFKFKKTRTTTNPKYAPENLAKTIDGVSKLPPVVKEALQEYQTALELRQRRRVRREAEKQREAAETANFEQAQREGAVKECECCYSDVAMNRMVHCDGAPLMHFFCKDCARRMAESQIGLSKYQLACMSMDGCSAGFAHDQRRLFLDRKTTVALERIEQEHVLRMAGIENLETCPFCPFAAEYPPVEINKEFACQNPGCETVSCRLCRKETHIPKTCAEFALESGPSVRLTIEEAMSAAMIRNCNKCGTPFIKEQGCNKMTCSRAGCGNVQCYVCHKSCEYAHFDDTTRGGKKGNCPLFESAEKRHEEEVLAAEERAREAVVKSNPGLDVNLLKFKLSDKVIDDEKKRLDKDPVRLGRV